MFCNGERRRDKENVTVFDKPCDFKHYRPHHGVMGDSNIRVVCYKQGIPEIYELQDDGTEKEIEFDYGDDCFEYDNVSFDYEGYHFYFESGKPYYARMEEPDGTEWTCYYDYWYGDGFY